MHPQQSLHSGRLLRRTDFASSSANRKGHSRLGKFLKGPHCRRASAPLRRLYYWDRHHRTLVRPAVCEASTGTGDGTLSGGNQTGDSIGTPPDGQFMSSASTPGSENRSTFGTLIERLGALLEMRTVGVDAEVRLSAMSFVCRRFQLLSPHLTKCASSLTFLIHRKPFPGLLRWRRACAGPRTARRPDPSRQQPPPECSCPSVQRRGGRCAPELPSTALLRYKRQRGQPAHHAAVDAGLFHRLRVVALRG